MAISNRLQHQTSQKRLRKCFIFPHGPSSNQSSFILTVFTFYETQNYLQKLTTKSSFSWSVMSSGGNPASKWTTKKEMKFARLPVQFMKQICRKKGKWNPYPQVQPSPTTFFLANIANLSFKNVSTKALCQVHNDCSNTMIEN